MNKKKISPGRALNPRPAAYKAAALAELPGLVFSESWLGFNSNCSGWLREGFLEIAETE